MPRSTQKINTRRPGLLPSAGYNLLMKTCGTVLIVLTVVGCHNSDPAAGYTSTKLHRSDIGTICVQMFHSQSFRRDIEFELTRALAHRIELNTPYKVVADERQADTIIYGTIHNVSESGLAQQRDLDRPVASQVTLAVDVTWKDLRSGEFLLDNQRVRVAAPYWNLLGAGRDSAATGAAELAAARIVEAMEMPW